jgi:hypothetical protein
MKTIIGKTKLHSTYKQEAISRCVFSFQAARSFSANNMQSQLIAMMRGNTSMQGQLADTGTCR